MDLVKENRYLDRAYRVHIFTFRRAYAVYYNIYYICAARLAIYSICTAYLAVYNIYTTYLAIYNIRAAYLAIYNIYTACSAVYYNIYYICTASTGIGISKYLTTSPIYP